MTDRTPNVPLAALKRTKIIATVGPATNTYEAILELIREGANGLRLNFSHGTYEERKQQIQWIRRASKECGKPVAIIQDLQGPKIRLGDFDGVIEVQTGDELRFKYKADYERSGFIPTQYDLSKKVKRGERLYLYDGHVHTVVESVQEGVVYARAENDGELIKRKGINLPDTDFGGDVITKKDREDAAFGSTQDIDYVAMSFVQREGDLHKMRTILKNLGSDAQLMSKIETGAAVAHIEDIVRASDAIMVARGDLAIETDLESVPVVQRHIIALGLQYAKPTIVATQMLASMTDSPEPTRAEASDVATAVFLGADCVMLSDETANGKYPIDAIKVMKRIIRYSEQHPSLNSRKVGEYKASDNIRQNAVSSAVLTLVESITARAIVAETLTGATARQIASYRPATPVIAVTSSQRTAQQLALLYGVKSYVRPVDAEAALKLTEWLHKHRVLSKGDVVVIVSGRYPGVVGTTDTIKVRVLQ